MPTSKAIEAIYNGKEDSKCKSVANAWVFSASIFKLNSTMTRSNKSNFLCAVA